MVCSGQPTSIGNVLTESQAPIDVEDLISRTFDSEIGILINKALSALLKGLNGLIVPPVRVVPGFVVVATCGIESCYLSVYQIGYCRK